MCKLVTADNGEYYNDGIGFLMEKQVCGDGQNNICTIAFDKRCLSKAAGKIIQLMQCYTARSSCGNIYKLIFKVNAVNLPKYYLIQFYEKDPDANCYICGTPDSLFVNATESIDYKIKPATPFVIEERTANFAIFLNRYFEKEPLTLEEHERIFHTVSKPEDDDKIVHRMLLRHGKKFENLFYNGDVPENTSNDGAGITITNMIAYFCHWKPNAEDIIKRIFEKSQFYRNYINLWNRGNHLNHTIQNSLGAYNK